MITFVESPCVQFLNERCEYSIRDEDIARLDKYAARVKSSKHGGVGNLAVSYEQKCFKRVRIGRMYPADGNLLCGTYQNRRLNSALFVETSVDIDVVNCQPVLLLQMFKRYLDKPITTALESYINNRDAIIKQVIVKPEALARFNAHNDKIDTHKDCVKNLFLIILFGGDIGTWRDSYGFSASDYVLPELLEQFAAEIKTNTGLLLGCRSQEISHKVNCLIHQFDKDKTEYHNGKLLALIVQDVEFQVCMRAMNVWSKHSTVQVYKYDGFIATKRPDGDYDACLREIEAEVDKSLGYKVNFIVKPFVEPMIKMELSSMEKLIIEFIGTGSDTDYAKVLQVYCADYLTTKSGFYQYVDGVWLDTHINTFYASIYDRAREEVAAVLSKYCTDEKLAKLNAKISSITFVEKALKLAIAKNTDYNVEFDAQPNYLNFLNGTFNLDTHDLQPHNRKDYLSKQILHNFDESMLSEASYEAVAALIGTWFDCWGDDSALYTRNFLTEHACGLHGNNSSHKAIINSGPTSRNGKSTWVKLLQRVLNDYMVELKIAYFIADEKNASAAGADPFLVNLRSCRFASISEVDDNLKFNVQKFKSLTGKDQMVCRDLYGGAKAIVSFIPTATLVMCTNSNIAFANGGTNALTNRLSYYKFANSFSDGGPTATIKEGHPNFRLMDPAFDDKLKAIENLLIHVLIYLRNQVNGIVSAMKSCKIADAVNQAELEDVDPVRAWSNDTIVIDSTPFGAPKDRFVMTHFPKLTIGMRRMVTLDYLWDKFRNDRPNEDISERAFKLQIGNVFNDLYNSGFKTRCFGGQKRVIKDIHYIGFDREDDDVVANNNDADVVDDIEI